MVLHRYTDRSVTSSSSQFAHREAVVLLARSATTSVPLQEMAVLAGRLATSGDSAHVMFAFMEEGEPSLEEVIRRLRDQSYASLVIVPILLPMEPRMVAAVECAVEQLQREWSGAWPAVRIGYRSPANTDAMITMLAELVASARETVPLSAVTSVPSVERSSAERYRSFAHR